MPPKGYRARKQATRLSLAPDDLTDHPHGKEAEVEREEKRKREREEARRRISLFIFSWWRHRKFKRKLKVVIRLQRWWRRRTKEKLAQFIWKMAYAKKVKEEKRRRVGARQSEALSRYYTRGDKKVANQNGVLCNQWNVEPLDHARRVARLAERTRADERDKSDAAQEVFQDLRAKAKRVSEAERLDAMIENVAKRMQALDEADEKLAISDSRVDAPNTPKYVSNLTKKSDELFEIAHRARTIGPSQAVSADRRGGRVLLGNSTQVLGRYDMRDFSDFLFSGKGPGEGPAAAGPLKPRGRDPSGSDYRDPNWSAAKAASYFVETTEDGRETRSFKPTRRAPATFFRHARPDWKEAPFDAKRTQARHAHLIDANHAAAHDEMGFSHTKIHRQGSFNVGARKDHFGHSAEVG